MGEVKRTERGWGGHFICAYRCNFRRNTLLEVGKREIVISTVGMMEDYKIEGKIDAVGSGGRYYETMAFHAKKDGPYWDIAVGRKVSFDSEWAICAESVNDLPEDVDNLANDMHEAVVTEIAAKLLKGEKL